MAVFFSPFQAAVKHEMIRHGKKFEPGRVFTIIDPAQLFQNRTKRALAPAKHASRRFRWTADRPLAAMAGT